jgi:uncharacterized protein YndB with AHSA1/START domain
MRASTSDASANDAAANHAVANDATVLQTRRTFPARREIVFRAWTEPKALRQWFAVAEGYTTPIAEVDLRVGGRYRLGMQAPGSDELMVASGAYREVAPPERLVFTWRWESDSPEEPETLVTVEFHEGGDSTEVVLTHSLFPGAAERDMHLQGWQGCLNRLESVIHRLEV